MKKTVIFLTLIFTSLSLMFTGCSASSPSTTVSPSSEKTSPAVAPGEVAYWDVLHPHIAGSQVQGLTDVVAVASGTRQDIMFGLDYCLALESDGTVWSWIASGSGNPVSDAKAMQVAGLSHITAIATGTGNSLALDSSGHVWYWYAYGDLSSGITPETPTSTNTPTTPASRNPTPVMVAGLDHVTAIAAGMRFSLALLDDGTVMAWGENEWGQLGDGTTVNSDVPVKVQGLSDVVAIAAGDYHSLALKADGTVWAWGDNESGELGDGTTTNSYTPVRVKGLSGVTAIAAGEAHSLALKKDGTVWSWGNNENGQAGNGTQNRPDEPGVTTPVRVKNLTDVVAIADGGISGGGPDIDGGTVKYRAGYGLALEADGGLWTWGAYGDTSEPQSNPCRKTPVAVSGLSGVRFMTAGGDYAVAVVPAEGTTSSASPASPVPTASVSTDASLSQAATGIDKSLVTVKGADGMEITGVVVGDGSQVATVWDFEASSNVSF